MASKGSIEKSIAYKDQDGISFNKVYGYKTLFAYFKEAEAGVIMQEVLDSKIGFMLNCGEFSYAEIPKYYDCIMGVSGTLQTLSDAESGLLKQKYSIENYTYVPSVYGQNTLKFGERSQEDCLIEGRGYYFTALCNEIKKRLCSLGCLSQPDRAVIVFFDTTPRLMEFYASPELEKSQLTEFAKVFTLVEETNDAEKESIIRSAVTMGTVTLMNKVFGRGTDFICYDSKLIQNGGVHVIQTFVSENIAEETQIRGRAARQGNNGSFGFVLLDSELERFDISASDIEDLKGHAEYFSRINEFRIKSFATAYTETLRAVEEIKEKHVTAMEFLSRLAKNQTALVREHLLSRNKAVVAGYCSADGLHRIYVDADS